MKKLIAVLLVIMSVGLWPAVAEYVPSPTVDAMYDVKSDCMTLSEAPDNLVIYDMIRVDISYDAVNERDELTAEIKLPVVPEDLEDIVIWDGYHVAHAKWEVIDEDSMRILIKSKDMWNFDGTVCLYMLFIGYIG